MLVFLKKLKNLKKGFTLMELSVVLLIMALLIGALIVGLSLVDIAKAQKFGNLFDNHTKEYTLYVDAKGILPGNSDTDNCKRDSEFYSPNGKEQDEKYCNAGGTNAASVAEGYTGSSTVAGNKPLVCFLNTMRFMQQAGHKVGVATDLTTPLDQLPEGATIDKTLLTSVQTLESLKTILTSAVISQTQGMLDFEPAGAISYIGFDGSDLSKQLAYIRGSWGETTEFTESEAAYKLVDGKNAAVVYDYINDNNGVVTAKIANTIDKKIDDGRPGTGSIIALKTGAGRGTKTACYGELEAGISSAYYLGGTNKDTGCNLLKILD